MKRSCFAVMLIVALCIPGMGYFRVGAHAYGGYFILPDAVGGFVTQGGYDEVIRGNPFISAEPVSGSTSGYEQIRYRYSHPFAPEVLPNGGGRLTGEYVFPRNLVLGADAAFGFSLYDATSSHTVSDTLPYGVNSIIPCDFQVRTATSNDVMYLKTASGGAYLGYKTAVGRKVHFNAGVGVGVCRYLTMIRTEQTDITMAYFQKNGNRVYAESQGSTFEVFGIAYRAAYMRPGVGLEWELSPDVSLRTDLVCPLSYVEKGYRWTDRGTSATTFYPGSRFTAANMMLSAGVVLSMGREETR